MGNKSFWHKKMHKIILLLEVIVILGTLLFGFTIQVPSSVVGKEIKIKARELETPQAVHNYLWHNVSYEYKLFPVNINTFWKTRFGDCTEVMGVEYLMIKELGFKVKRCSGFMNNTKHHFTEYYNGTDWIRFDKVEGGACV